jgi:zinc transporter ZupT
MFFTLFRKKKWILAISSSFSGGLFLGICFLHILPESEEVFASERDLKKVWDIGSMPAFLIIGVFLGILWIEKIGFFHTHSHLNGQDHTKQTESSVAMDPLFTDRGKELDLSQLDSQEDLEDVFKSEID